MFKNQTNLFDYEGSRSLNSCNQNLLLSFEHCQIKSPKGNQEMKCDNIYESHCWVQTRRVL